jgi:hypothetical protein
VALKVEIGSGWVNGESSVGATVFVVLVCVWVYFCCCRLSGFFFVRDCRALGLCKVDIVCCSVGDECEGGRGSLVTGLEENVMGS